MKRTVTAISVEDVEKRRQPSKHYVYLIYVTWSDGSINLIFRRYNSFFELQNKLLDKFPDESGTVDPTRRIIPFLPGKIIFGRSHIRDVAVKRLKPINDYCKALIRLPSQISECDEVLQFFETTSDDLKPRTESDRKTSKDGIKSISEPKLLDQYVSKADYVKEGRNECSLREGQVVQVIEKTQTGWWFINGDYDQGWVPSSYLEREDGVTENRVVKATSSGREEKFMVIESYKAMMPDEISLDKGVIVDVLERNLDGWWLVKYKGRKGRAPSTNLVEAGTLQADRLKNRAARKSAHGMSVEKVPNMMAVSNIHLQKFNRENPPRASSSQNRKGSYRQVSFDSFSSGDEESVYSSIDEGAVEASRRNLRRSKSAVSDSPYRKSGAGAGGLPRRSSGSMRENYAGGIMQVKPRPPRPPPPAMTVTYTVVEDFISQADDGITLRKGQTLQVLEKDTTGWWLVVVDGNQGWAPSSYIKEQKNPRPARPPPPNLAKKKAVTSNAVKPSSASSQSPKLLPKPAISSLKKPQPAANSSRNTTAEDLATNIDEKRNNVKSDLEAKFGIQLRKGTPGSPGSGVRKSGHIPTTALIPKSTTKPTVLLSQARGPIASHFSAKTEAQGNSRLGDISGVNSVSDELYTNTADDPQVNALTSQLFDDTSVDGNGGNKRPPYVNLDIEGEEAQTVLHRACAVYDFTQAEEGEVSIVCAQIVDVLQDDVSGWSFIRTDDGAQGWCPANYLEKCANNSSMEDHEYQNEQFPVCGPTKMEGIKGANTKVQNVEGQVDKFEISDITKVKLKPVSGKTAHNSSNGSAKPLLPVKPTKALKPPVISKKPAIASAKPQFKTKERPTISAKPKLNGAKSTGSTATGNSVLKLAKSFDQS